MSSLIICLNSRIPVLTLCISQTRNPEWRNPIILISNACDLGIAPGPLRDSSALSRGSWVFFEHRRPRLNVLGLKVNSRFPFLAFSIFFGLPRCAALSAFRSPFAKLLSSRLIPPSMLRPAKVLSKTSLPSSCEIAVGPSVPTVLSLLRTHGTSMPLYSAFPLPSATAVIRRLRTRTSFSFLMNVNSENITKLRTGLKLEYSGLLSPSRAQM
jgi:hypothetical protein